MSNVEQLPQKAELAAGAPVQAIVPRSMEDAYRIATAVVKAGMAPKDMNTPEKCLVAIMQGAECGMTPMQSLQRIAVINGRPTIWGDAAIGLVRASGLCEYVKETIKGEGDKMVAVCEAKRRGESAIIVGRFSVEDAKQAGLWGKAGPWKQYSRRMLQMRARGFCLRDGFADVLGGMYLKEELDADEREMRDITPPAPPPDDDVAPPAPPSASSDPAPEPRPAGNDRPQEPASPADAEVLENGQQALPDIPQGLDRRGATDAPQMDDVDQETGEVLGEERHPVDPVRYLEDLDAQMAGAKDTAMLDEIWLLHEGRSDELVESGEMLTDHLAEARRLYDAHKARLEF